MVWLWRHRLLRTLALMVGTMNLAFTAGESVLVLFAQAELGVGAVGCRRRAGVVVQPPGALLIVGGALLVLPLLCLPVVNSRTLAAARAQST